jgi:hypothetical protein
MSEHQRATRETKMATDDHWRIDHTGMGVSNITKAAKFYGAALGVLGLKPIARITKTFAVATIRNLAQSAMG